MPRGNVASFDKMVASTCDFIFFSLLLFLFFFLLVKEICFSSFNILFKFILSTLELKLCSSNTFCQKTFVHKSKAGCGLNEAENTHRSPFYCNPQFCKMRENTIELSSRRSNIPHLPKCIFISTISNLEDFFFFQ